MGFDASGNYELSTFLNGQNDIWKYNCKDINDYYYILQNPKSNLFSSEDWVWVVSRKDQGRDRNYSDAIELRDRQ